MLADAAAGGWPDVWRLCWAIEAGIVALLGSEFDGEPCVDCALGLELVETKRLALTTGCACPASGSIGVCGGLELESALLALAEVCDCGPCCEPAEACWGVAALCKGPVGTD